MEVLEEVKSMLGDVDNHESSKFIAPFPLLTKSAVESLRYRAEVIIFGLLFIEASFLMLDPTISEKATGSHLPTKDVIDQFFIRFASIFYLI